MKRIKSKINSWYYKTKHFFESFVFLKAYFSPFKPPKVKFYFGKIAIGVPYFYPRKSVKFTKQDCINEYNRQVQKFKDKNLEVPNNLSPDNYKRYRKFVDIKYFGFNYCGLGWKTKWSDTDYRFEWNPIYSLVLFKKQIAILFVPIEYHHYWESWLYYNYSTDKSKSKVERIKYCMEKFPNTWVSYKDDKETKINYYSIILKKKYLKYIKVRFMKKPEDYLKGLFEEPFNLEEDSIESDFIQIIKEAQIDVIDATVKMCAKEAKTKDVDGGWQGCSTSYTVIDKESILQVADKLKKELE